MRRSSLACLSLLLSVASLGCPESRAHRTHRILERVSRMHREIYDSHRGMAQAFARQEQGRLPQTAQGWVFLGWGKCPLADTDGDRISGALLKAWMDLRARAEAGDAAVIARDYAAQRARLSRAALADLGAPGDPATLDGRIRAASAEVHRRDLAIETRYQAEFEAAR